MFSRTSIWGEATLVIVAAGSLTALLVAVRGAPVLSRPSTDSATCSGPLPEAPAVHWISPDKALPLLGRPGVAFVDTRSRAEYEAGHVLGAIHVPMEGGTMDQQALGFLTDLSTVVAYCDASGQCARSSRFASLLSSSGFSDVRVLEGGFPAWLDGTRPAESGECKQCP